MPAQKLIAWSRKGNLPNILPGTLSLLNFQVQPPHPNSPPDVLLRVLLPNKHDLVYLFTSYLSQHYTYFFLLGNLSAPITFVSPASSRLSLCLILTLFTPPEHILHRNIDIIFFFAVFSRKCNHKRPSL